jgi:integrase
MPPGAAERPKPRLPFATYAATWLQGRNLKTRTREHYQSLLDLHLIPAFGNMPITAITADDIRAWHARFGADTPTVRAHCYRLLNTILGTAASDGKIPANPCLIRGAGTAHRVKKIRIAELDELEIITAAMPEQYRAMVLLAAWCALRFGELSELRRRDITISEDDYGVVRVERAVVRVDAGFEVTTPKSASGVRDVEIPPHLLPVIADHLARFVGPGPDALLFGAPRGGDHLAAPSLYRHFYKARAAAGRDDLRWHDLRYSGAVLAAQSGATLAELMGRLGHSSPGAAMRYQHAAAGRDREIARRLSGLATPKT